MSKSLLLAAALGAGSFLALGTAASAATAIDYNVFAIGDYSSANTEVNGAVAVGGDATFSSFGIGKDLGSGYTGSALVVGGDLNYFNGEVKYGDVTVGGDYTVASLGIPNGTITAHAVVPVNFAAEAAYLGNASANFAGLAANGTLSGNVFTGTDSALNIFNITAAQLAGLGGGFDVNIAPGSVAVFNVSGSSFASNYPGSVHVNGSLITNSDPSAASALLFNFTDAGSLAFNGSWAGNVLAPGADVSLGYGAFFGSLYADNISSNAEFYMAGFSGFDDGGTPPSVVPEPASWALMIAGFGLLGGMLRRRRRVLA